MRKMMCKGDDRPDCPILEELSGERTRRESRLLQLKKHCLPSTTSAYGTKPTKPVAPMMSANDP
jgi:hypothetical protein